MSVETIKVPDIGGAEAVEVIEISVKAGDRINVEDTLLVLESDKASMDVPSPQAGTVKKVLVKVGDNVSQGDAIVEMDVEGESGEAPAQAASAPQDEPAEKPAPEAPGAKKTGSAGPRTVELPDLGTDDDVDVIELSVAVGDVVAEGDTLMVLEGDKATMDVPSPYAGKITKLLVQEGAKVKTGAAVAEMEAESGAEEAAAEPEAPKPAAGDKPAASETAPKKVAASAGPKTVELPDLGTEDAVDVIELSVSEGDDVAEGDTLMVLEGDKATMDVPSPYAGKITKLLVKEGAKVKTGTAVAEMTVTGGEAEAEPAPAAEKPADKPKPAAESTAAAPAPAAPAKAGALSEPEAPATEVYAGPMVRQFARELGVDLRNVKGSGSKGRVTREDVQAYVKQALSALQSGKPAAAGAAVGSGLPGVPDVDYSAFGEIEEVPLSKIARLTAANMVRSWLNVPAVTQFDDADITDLEAFRKSLKDEGEKRGTKLTPLPFLLMACARAMKNNPVINRSWHSSGEKVIQKKFINIGMAVDTPRGLVVPVIRNVDQKGLWELAAETAELAKKARDGKLTAAEMQGGGFTISSLGAMGGTGFTPIVNTPEAAILGVSRASMQPVWNGKEFVPRNMLPLCLSYDHRLVNGGDGGRFMMDLVALLGDVRRLLL